MATMTLSAVELGVIIAHDSAPLRIRLCDAVMAAVSSVMSATACHRTGIPPIPKIGIVVSVAKRGARYTCMLNHEMKHLFCEPYNIL